MTERRGEVNRTPNKGTTAVCSEEVGRIAEPDTNPEATADSAEKVRSAAATHGSGVRNSNNNVLEDSSGADVDESPYSIQRWLEQSPSEDAIGILMLKLKIPQTTGSGILAGL